MRKLLLITLLILFSTHSLSAQGYYDKCYFGTAAVDFGGWYPSVLTNSQMVAVETAVSMCSANGDLLFYSNGGDSPTITSSFGAIWNANHQVMENGLLGLTSGCVSSFHGGVAFPASGKSSKSFSNSSYYIFMRDCVESSVTSQPYNTGLTYCEIDMSANNGLGKVISVNTAVPFDTGYGLSTNHEPLAALLNGADDGWYVFSYNLDSLYSIEVNSNGIGAYKSHVVGERAIVFSPSREHVVVGSKLYNYDAFNNELSFITSFSESTYAFSANGEILYGLGGGRIVQYDLSAVHIVDSKIEIGSGITASSLHLTPDHRIYLHKSNSAYLPGFIDCPNTLGANCGLTMTAIDLGGKQSGYVFTNIPANFLYHDERGCQAEIESHEKITALFEVYPNPSDGIFTISMHEFTEPLPIHVFSLDGKVVYSGEISNNNSEIDLSFVDAGIYIAEVMGARKRLVLR